MAFYKGITGFVALGGFVNGSPTVNGAVAQTLTTMNIHGTVVGVIAPGDTFTIAGETGSPVHTVTGTAFYAFVANAVTGVTFTPGIATGGVVDGAAITFTSNVLAQSQAWDCTVAVADLDTTSLGDVWKSSVTEIGSWSGSITVRLDYALAQQATLINQLTGAAPGGVLASLFMGVDKSTAAAKGFYGAAVLKSGAVQVQMGKVVDLKISFTGKGQLNQNWQ